MAETPDNHEAGVNFRRPTIWLSQQFLSKTHTFLSGGQNKKLCRNNIRALDMEFVAVAMPRLGRTNVIKHPNPYSGEKGILPQR